MEKLLNILENSELAGYKVVEKTTISHQAFFIRQKLDQHRISDVKHTNVTVYVDKDGKRGNASKEIFNGASEAEIKKDIEDLKFNALLAMNPYYELEKDVKHYEAMEKVDLLASLKNVISAVGKINDTETEKINSYEIFVNQNYYHIVNSNGVDVSYNALDEMVEIVINSIKDNREVEVYQMIKCGADQTVENIVSEIKKSFKTANDRSNAILVDKMLNTRVLISGSDLKEFFGYFLTQSNTNANYRKMCNVKIGDYAQNGDECDKITIKAVRNLPYSSSNNPYNNDGTEAKDFTLVKDGQYVNYNGDKRTAYYLGVDEISPVNNFVVEGGSKSVSMIKSAPYLEIVQFSSFDMDAMTGDFGGEFRLAYLYDGNKVTTVTSGSITCNMREVLDHIHFSKESVQYNNCIVPEVIELSGINVAGK